MIFHNRQLIELLDRNRSDAPNPISAEDFAEFLRNPQFWCKTESGLVLSLDEEIRTWMQGVYDELGIPCEVPPVSELTTKQKESLQKFGFRLFFVPAISEEQYPASFVKPAWRKYLEVHGIKRKPLSGCWVAIETTPKPNWDDPAGYPQDRLAAALKRTGRFGVMWDVLHDDILVQIAQVTGFPKKATRLPTVEEWNFLANLFNWLREKRQEQLPDFGSTNSWEWCESASMSGHLFVGRREDGGLADVSGPWWGGGYGGIGFRVLVVL